MVAAELSILERLSGLCQTFCMMNQMARSEIKVIEWGRGQIRSVKSLFLVFSFYCLCMEKNVNAKVLCWVISFWKQVTWCLLIDVFSEGWWVETKTIPSFPVWTNQGHHARGRKMGAEKKKLGLFPLAPCVSSPDSSIPGSKENVDVEHLSCGAKRRWPF